MLIMHACLLRNTQPVLSYLHFILEVLQRLNSLHGTELLSYNLRTTRNIQKRFSLKSCGHLHCQLAFGTMLKQASEEELLYWMSILNFSSFKLLSFSRNSYLKQT